MHFAPKKAHETRESKEVLLEMKPRDKAYYIHYLLVGALISFCLGARSRLVQRLGVTVCLAR